VHDKDAFGLSIASKPGAWWWALETVWATDMAWPPNVAWLSGTTARRVETIEIIEPIGIVFFGGGTECVPQLLSW
jgi:hypothetical protein